MTNLNKACHSLEQELVEGQGVKREVAKFLTLIRSPAHKTYERDVNWSL